MQTSLNFYVSIVYLLAAIPYAWLGLFAWRKSPTTAAPFAWAMLGLSIWAFAYSLELFFPSLPLKLFFAKAGYLSSLSIPIFLLLFALEYTDKSHLLDWRSHLLLWVIPILSLLLIWSNEFHHLVWSWETISEMRGLRLLSIHYELFFWVQVIYSNGLALFAGVLLAVEMLQRSRIYRIQIGVTVLGILTLVTGDLFYFSGIKFGPNLNLTPLLFLPIVTGVAWAIERYRLLEIIPLEHLTVLKNMKDGVIVVNLNQRILYINPLIETLFGNLEKDVIGQPLEQISEKYGVLLASHLSQAGRPAEIQIGEGKQYQIFEMTVSPVASRNAADSQPSPGNIIILHEITERKMSEAALRGRETMMSALNLAAERFLKESAWEPHIPGILEKIGQAINVSRVYVFMNYSDEQGTVFSSQCYEWVSAGVTPQINNPDLQHINLREAGYGRWVRELSAGELIYGIVDQFPKAEQEILRQQDILSLAIAPIFVEKKWWGFIGFDECKNKRQWESADLEALHITASIFGSAEARARTEQRLIRRQRDLTLLQEIVGEALRAKTLKQMASDIAVRLANLINANNCFITVWDEAIAQTFPLSSYGMSTDTYLTLQPVSDGRTFTELALRVGHALIVNDSYNSHYLDHEIAKHCPSRSIIILPLIAAEKKLGAIILSFKEYHRFQPEEISICEQASHLIELAFEKFKAMEQAQRRADTSETLRRASAAITETLGTDETVSRILEQLKQVIPYDSASVQLIDGNELEIVGGSGFPDPSAVVGIRFAIPGDNPNTVVVETGRPYLLRNVEKAYNEFNKTPHTHIQSWLGVPLIAQDKLIGLLAIDSIEENHFTDDDISIAMTFANQVSIALENARIFKETQDQALTDPLTGVYNRRGLLDLAKADFARSITSGLPLSGIMIDLDHFKDINDTHGHDAGDQVLRELAKRCKKSIRGLDYMGRYGGEEFLIILPETNINTGKIVAERLRKVIAGTPMIVGEGLELNITASLGVAQRDENTTNLETLVTRADQAMYVAKHKGRNCVAVSN